jgi:hypothetical protein
MTLLKIHLLVYKRLFDFIPVSLSPVMRKYSIGQRDEKGTTSFG